MRRTLTLLSLILAMLLPLAACGGEAGESDAASIDDMAAVSDALEAEVDAPEAEVVEEAAAIGTRDNPIPLGAAAQVGDWEMTVISVNPDAAELVAAENQFNDAPEAGNVFVMIKLSGSYLGEDSGSIFGNLAYKILGADGNTFAESCGVIPNALTDTGETFAGASVDGNLCFSVEQAQLDGALLILEEAFSLDSNRVFFALQ